MENYQNELIRNKKKMDSDISVNNILKLKKQEKKEVKNDTARKYG